MILILTVEELDLCRYHYSLQKSSSNVTGIYSTKEVKGYRWRVNQHTFPYSFIQLSQDSNSIRPRYYKLLKDIYTILLLTNICLMVPSYNFIYKIIKILLMFIIQYRYNKSMTMFIIRNSRKTIFVVDL